MKNEESWGLKPRFTFLAAETEVGKIPGVGIVFDSHVDRRAFADVIVQYLSSPGGSKRLAVSFDDHQPANGRSDMRMSVASPSISAWLEILDIDRSDVDQLEASLARYKYYFILVGSMGPDSTFIPDPSEFHLFKADILRNGERIVGNSAGLWPKRNPFSE